MKQKVLIVTYYWPPAGGPGVQRWLKFVKYLTEMGVQPWVFIPKNPNYPMVDTSLSTEVPEGIKVVEQPIWEPYQLASFFSANKTKRISSGIIRDNKKQSFLERAMLWVRGNLFIPDARKYWVGPTVQRLTSLLQEENIHTLITTGPPHSLHLIGLRLKSRLDIQWLADFRDPWTGIGYHKKLKLSSFADRKHRSLEKKVLQNADTIITTSDTTTKAFQLMTSKPVVTITNGFDHATPEVSLDKQFTIAHIGSLLTDRNPKILWEVLSELIHEIPDFKTTLQLRLIGVVGSEVWAALKAYGLEPYVENLGYVAHQSVLRYQAQSQVLLLLEIDSEETQGIIPGKLFEYLRAQRPILAIGPKEWEAGMRVEQHKAGCFISATQKELLKKVLVEWYKKYQKQQLYCEPYNTEQYHRKALTERLRKLLTWESF
ncbi:MAG: glycosyl transferase family 1 [Bacteroidota bacterium]